MSVRLYDPKTFQNIFLENFLNSFFHQNMDFNVSRVNKTQLDWQPNKTKQSDNEKSHQKKVNESASFIPEVMKISSDKTRQ